MLGKAKLHMLENSDFYPNECRMHSGNTLGVLCDRLRMLVANINDCKYHLNDHNINTMIDTFTIAHSQNKLGVSRDCFRLLGRAAASSFNPGAAARHLKSAAVNQDMCFRGPWSWRFAECFKWGATSGILPQYFSFELNLLPQVE